jgi:hypothetical protein
LQKQLFDLRNEPTPEANGYGVGSAARLKLRQKVTDVGLDRLLRQVEALPDLAVDETVCNKLEHFDLASRRFLLELAENRRIERDHGPRATRAAASRSGFEPPAVIAITVQDLLALRGVHRPDIGLPSKPL